MLFWGKEADFSSLGFLAAGCWGFGLWAFFTFPSTEAAVEFYIFGEKKNIVQFNLWIQWFQRYPLENHSSYDKNVAMFFLSLVTMVTMTN